MGFVTTYPLNVSTWRLLAFIFPPDVLEKDSADFKLCQRVLMGTVAGFNDFL